MAEIHNISDIRIIQVLQDEHNAMREILNRFPSYDPAESHTDILLEIFASLKQHILCLRSREDELRREISYLKSQINALETEKNSEKSPAASPDSASYRQHPLGGRW